MYLYLLILVVTEFGSAFYTTRSHGHTHSPLGLISHAAAVAASRNSPYSRAHNRRQLAANNIFLGTTLYKYLPRLAEGENCLDEHSLGAYMAGFWLLGLVYIACNLVPS